MYLIVLGLSTESSLKIQWIEVSLKVLDVKTLEFKIDFIVKEDLDKLMEKSKDVSNLSLDFYKQAKKANKRCCSLY